MSSQYEFCPSCDKAGDRRICPWDAYVSGVLSECGCCDSCREKCRKEAGNPTGAEIQKRLKEAME